jgi:hypothetical protein
MYIPTHFEVTDRARLEALKKSPKATDQELAAAMTREQPRSKPSIDNPE